MAGNMFTENEVRLFGNLCVDPKQMYTRDGRVYVTFTLVTNERKKDKDNNWTDDAMFHHVVVYGESTAKHILEQCKKGSPLLVKGSLRNSRYTDSKNIVKYWTDIVCQGSGVIFPEWIKKNPIPSDAKSDFEMKPDSVGDNLEEPPFAENQNQLDEKAVVEKATV